MAGGPAAKRVPVDAVMVTIIKAERTVYAREKEGSE
jgi:hypothetical protein